MKIKNKAIQVLLMGLPIVILWLYPVSQPFEGEVKYLHLHTALESFSVIVCALIFAVSWNAYAELRASNITLLGCALLSTGLVNIAHILSFPGMPDFVTPAGVEKTINFWLFARLIFALALLVVALRPWQAFKSINTRYYLFVGSLILTSIIYWLGLYKADEIPHTFVDGQGLTSFKIVAEYVVMALFLAAAVLFYGQTKVYNAYGVNYLFNAAVLSVFAELCFTVYSSVSDIYNLLGHLYKVASFIYLYLAVFVVSVKEPFERAVHAELLSKSRLEKIEEKEEQLLSFYNLGLVGLTITSPDKGWLRINNRLCEMLEYSEGELREMTWAQLTYPDDLAADVEQFNKLLANELDGYSLEKRFVSRTGKIIPTHLVVSCIRHQDGQVNYVTAMVQDITEQKLGEEKLLLSARVFNDTKEGIAITNAQQEIIDVNPAFCEITGYSREEVIGQNPSMLNSGQQSPEFYADMWQSINENGHWQGEVWNRRKSRELYAELLNISTVLDDNENVINYIIVFSDITDSKHQQEELSRMAHYDGLTGLPNRALFVDHFNQSIAHSKRTHHQLAVCFLDLDNFKPINDNYGHEVGDKLLIEVAKRIASCIREEDTVSRQGGDEFALLLNDIESSVQCEQTLERIHLVLAQPYLIADASHKITASSGATIYPNDDGDIDILLRHADQAMYQAKLVGKNRYRLFNPIEDQLTIEKHHQLDEIEHALVNNEFQLYYQPKVNMVTGDVFGAEALIRWNHPEKGILPPLDFLPIIKETKLEIKIGNWVINEALTQLEVWHQQGIRLEVSINIASHHLLSETFFADLETAFAKHAAVDAQCFQLEILETSALGDLNAITTVIEACQSALGITFSLDDFGTGYSSLTHLRSLPVDTIKIDRSFVRDMLDDPNDYAIIDGVIGLADSFRRRVIAEGVETTNHGLMLLFMGCKEAQGYGIAKPMPADEYPQWLNAYTPNKAWLHCGNKQRTSKEKKIEFFRLVTEHWKNRLIENVQSSPEDIENWPIMNSKRCPCGTWIQQAVQEQLFASANLEQLDAVHNALHVVAQSIYQHYQDGDTNTAREGLSELKLTFEQMNHVMKICEQLLNYLLWILAVTILIRSMAYKDTDLLS